MTRREFLGGLAAASASPVLAVPGGADVGTHDPNLAVFLSDIHCNGRTKGWVQHQHPILRRYVAEILQMRPLPANVVVFGDFSASKGWTEDFRLAREILQPLMDAGIRFTCGMGNHDKRRNFLSVFPEYEDRLLVKDRIVSKIELPHCDFIMLDSLREKEGEASNFVDGRVDGDQLAWLRGEIAAAKRPLFIGAHHDVRECGIRKEIATGPTVCGYVFGHEHVWAEGYVHDGTYGNSQTVQTATLPSAGYYGDVGYALFRTFPDRAELTLRQDDFFFNRDWCAKGFPRPKNWQARIDAHKDAKVTFYYEKTPDYWHPAKGKLLLTFDDRHWDQWLAAQPLFAKYGAHVTFFPYGDLDASALAALRRLQDAGHTIGIHTRHHGNAAPFFAKAGGEAYWTDEVLPQKRMLESAGIRAETFAYPCSDRNDETDRFLLAKGLVRLRSGKGGDLNVAFPAKELATRRMVEGLGVGAHYKTDIDKVCVLVRRLAREDLALVIYSHDIAQEPSKIGMRTEWLERILATAEENGVPVRGFGEI